MFIINSESSSSPGGAEKPETDSPQVHAGWTRVSSGKGLPRTECLGSIWQGHSQDGGREQSYFLRKVQIMDNREDPFIRGGTGTAERSQTDSLLSGRGERNGHVGRIQTKLTQNPSVYNKPAWSSRQGPSYRQSSGFPRGYKNKKVIRQRNHQ